MQAILAQFAFESFQLYNDFIAHRAQQRPFHSSAVASRTHTYNRTRNARTARHEGKRATVQRLLHAASRSESGGDTLCTGPPFRVRDRLCVHACCSCVLWRWVGRPVAVSLSPLPCVDGASKFWVCSSRAAIVFARLCVFVCATLPAAMGSTSPSAQHQWLLDFVGGRRLATTTTTTTGCVPSELLASCAAVDGQRYRKEESGFCDGELRK